MSRLVFSGLRGALVAVCAFPAAAFAQQQPQQSEAWAQLPRMVLERQFAGPLQDTVVQRWRDPADGTICYIYLPVSAPHTPPTQSGFVQYGATTIGSISCLPPSRAPAVSPQTRAPAAQKGAPPPASPQPLAPPAR